MIKLETIAQVYNLRFSQKDKVVYGDVDGINYTLTVTENYNFAMLEASLNVESSGKLAEITKELSLKSKEMKKVIINVITSPFSIKAQVNISNAKRVEMLRDVFALIKSTADTYSLKSCCSACGENVPAFAHIANEGVTHICDSCSADIINKLEEGDAANRGKKGNVIAGVVGAFLGALLGGVLWVILFQFGYIVAIVALICVVCAYKGYTMFSGKKDIKAAIIAVIMSVVMIFLAHYLSWGIEIYKEFNSYGITIFDAIASTYEFIFKPEIITSFFGDLIIGYIFLAVGSYSFIKNAIKNPTGKMDFKRIENNEINV